MENTASYSMPSAYAGIIARVKAYLMDLVIQLTVSFTLGIIINLIMSGFDFSELRLSVILLFSYIILPIFSLAYSIYFEQSEKQATIGKQVVDIKVTDTDGNRLSWGKAIVRNLLKYIVTIGSVVAIFTDKKQALHDMAASTIVTKIY